MDWSIFKKTLCEKFHISFTRSFFLFGFTSGSDNQAYVITPQVAKGIIEGLTHKVAEYEKKYGTIDTTGLESGIESPIQLQ